MAIFARDKDYRALALFLLPCRNDSCSPSTAGCAAWISACARWRSARLLHVLQFLPQLLRALHLRTGDRPQRSACYAGKNAECSSRTLFTSSVRISVVCPACSSSAIRTSDLSSGSPRQADHRLAHVVAFELAVAIFVRRLEQSFTERAQMRAAVAGILAVD